MPDLLGSITLTFVSGNPDVDLACQRAALTLANHLPNRELAGLIIASIAYHQGRDDAWLTENVAESDLYWERSKAFAADALTNQQLDDGKEPV